MEDPLVPAQESNLDKFTKRVGIKSLVVAFMCGAAVMRTIGARAKVTSAEDAPFELPARANVTSAADAPLELSSCLAEESGQTSADDCRSICCQLNDCPTAGGGGCVAYTATYQPGLQSCCCGPGNEMQCSAPDPAAAARSASSALSILSLIPQLIFVALTALTCYLVNKWHNEIKEAGKTPTCGLKSILCCLFCGCGGALTICKPIDEP